MEDLPAADITERKIKPLTGRLRILNGFQETIHRLYPPHNTGAYSYWFIDGTSDHSGYYEIMKKKKDKNIESEYLFYRSTSLYFLIKILCTLDQNMFVITRYNGCIFGGNWSDLEKKTKKSQISCVLSLTPLKQHYECTLEVVARPFWWSDSDFITVINQKLFWGH